MRVLQSIILSAATLSLTACGVIYHSPEVTSGTSNGSKVRVVPITSETVMVANRSGYTPQTLPAIFSATASGGSAIRTGSGDLPEPALQARQRPIALETRLPSAVPQTPYTIGVGDVVLLATPQMGGSIEQLSGLLAAQNSRQGYTVQDDGAIAIPNVGRIPIADLTLEEAEAELFQRLVENQIDPTFSLEIAEFNSKKAAIGGAVGTPTVVPITLTPLHLSEVLAAAGGITVPDMDYASIRIYRNGRIYQIPLEEFYKREDLQDLRVVDGDSIFLDSEYDLTLAQAYFEEQIRLAEYRQSARVSAMQALQAEVIAQQNSLESARSGYLTRLELGSVRRDYVYLAGEFFRQSRFPLPFDQTASLADALYSDDGGNGVPTETGNVGQIYVLRSAEDPREIGAVTAWNLDARNAANLINATKFQLRPNDIIFVAEQPVTKWNRTIQQVVPSLITAPIAAAN